MSITKEESFNKFIHYENSMNNDPNKNSQFLVIILKYLLLFKRLDLDYLTVWIYTSGQSAYNLVERSIASLFDKLADIELNAFTYSKHFESINRKVTVVNKDLRYYNFKHTRERLCKLWGMIISIVIQLLPHILKSIINQIF